MTRATGARERARTEIAESIKAEARRQLADAGAARLSLRAVARELGMVSSALYRYYPSRDDLLTALIIDAYDAVGAAAERAVAAAPAADPVARWTAGCRAVRGWALANPHEYALLYGSPVPGYAAPETTTAPASRVARALIGVAEDADDAGLLDPVTVESADVLRDAEQLVRRLGVRLHPAAMARLVAAWSQLFGLVGFEVFGQFHEVVHAREEFFERAAADLGRGIGLRTPAA
ncbi:TetR/AcrR family transcriptional regulator [Streptomyces sp. NBC_01808]|uniref:TetR/AcrR family transcriptional regulator n=1 Tax=Streptomyces sp. NBC_01808 TaxID=2975947 RepID=UPI002DDB890F|nr:TetR/AcrR family transcriptional regulator [Streptomyces sp. NBC_01808]WSA36440.1 TetR/AcrR family transcriptional regulator [Streptomyces sp. NBC_01808]